MHPLKTLGLLTLAIVAALAFAPPGAALAQVEETLLCGVEPNEEGDCEGEAHLAGTAISASTTALLTVKEVALGVDGEIECDSGLEGTTAASVGEPLLPVEFPSLSFTNCVDNLSRECSATVLSLPYEASMVASEVDPGDGRLFLYESSSEGEPGTTIVCEDANPFTVDVNCTYEVVETDEEIEGGGIDLAELELEGGAEPSIIADGVELEEAEGAACPGSGPRLDATYQVDEPAPAFLAAGDYGFKVDPGVLNFTGENDVQETTVTNLGSTTWKITGLIAISSLDFDATDKNSCKGKSLKKDESCKVTVKCLKGGANGELRIYTPFAEVGGLKVTLRC
jgi:hypothetical protein